MNDHDARIAAAKNWLGKRWILAEPVRKPALQRNCHVRVPMGGWAALNEQIARILEGAKTS